MRKQAADTEKNSKRMQDLGNLIEADGGREMQISAVQGQTTWKEQVINRKLFWHQQLDQIEE